jgi:predicted GNAT superfamily acetyltransferase
MEFIRLIKENKTAIWNDYTGFDDVFKEVGAPFPPIEHLENIRKNNGEKIIAYDPENKIILGWIGTIPIDNIYAELAGIEVNKNYRNQGIATKLILKAQDFLSAMNINEFRFQTSPLFTSNTLLYLSKFQTEYIWNNTNDIPPDNIPWPVVDCAMKWPIQGKRINITQENAIIKNNVINWDEYIPSINESILSKKLRYHVMELPYLDIPTVLDNFKNKNFEIAKTPFRIFDEMTDRGYQIRNFIKYNEKNYFVFEKGTER